MVKLLGLTLGESDESPREIIRSNPSNESGENGWLIRFFDSAFFCEWIAVSYLYKHEHAGVRDYLCNRMYTLPLSGIESYLFQICYMMVHKPSPSLDKFVIDVCSKSLHIALKVHWFLMAELEDNDDNEGISRIQEKCQIAATLTGEWPPLVRPQNAPSSPGSKNQVLNKIFSSKQKLLSLASSPPPQQSLSFSPSSGSNFQDEASKFFPDENKIFNKFIHGPKVRDALLFRKSTEKDEECSEKDGFFRRLLRESRDEDEEGTSSSEGFFKRIFRESKNDSDERSGSKSVEDDEKDGFFRKIFKEKFEDKKTVNDRVTDEDKGPKSVEYDEKEGFFRKLFKDKLEEKKEVSSRNEDSEAKSSRSTEDDDKEGFFRKLIRDKFEDKKDVTDKIDEEDKGTANGEEEASEFSFFRKLFRVHLEDCKTTAGNEANSLGGLSDGSPGTENFFRKLFRDRDRSVEDSELFGLKRQKENLPGSPIQRNEKLASKPPLPNSAASQFRRGAYHESLDFVQTLCDTSYGLVDIFPVEDRKSSLRESLAELNLHIAEAQNGGGICFPMGKIVYRVVHIPEDEAVLLNSREKAPYLICVEVLKCEAPSNYKDPSNAQKLSKGGIPLANADALLQKPPQWAYPLQTAQEVYRNSSDRMSQSTSQAIDQAMAHMREAKVKFVSLNLSVEKEFLGQPGEDDLNPASREGNNDLEHVRVVLTADPGIQLDDIEEQPPRRREHRRVPSTIALEEIKAAAAKGVAPPGLPLKGAGQDSSDAQPEVKNGDASKASDALSGELWEVKRERIRSASTYGKLSGWDLRSIIVKSGDDCRQEHLAVQLISHFYDIFQEAGLPLWLRPYEVLVTSSYTALIETIPDTASLHSLKNRFPNIASLRDFFVAKYEENSPAFKLAQVFDRLKLAICFFLFFTDALTFQVVL